MEVWLLLVDYKFQAIGRRFTVSTTSGDFNINDLKKGVGEKMINTLSHAGVDCSDLTVWKTKGSMIIDRSTVKRLAEILRDINVDDKVTIEKLSEDDQVADLGLSESQTLLVRQPARAPELKEFKRYKILTQGMSPSEGANLTNYCKTQADDTQAIYDGRRAGAAVSRISPPLQIFHPIFGDFIRSVNHPDSDAQPTTGDLKNVYDLMSFGSEIRSNWTYSDELRDRLGHILKADVHEERDHGDYYSVITLQIGDTRIAYLFLEPKHKFDGKDPAAQVALRMKRFWIHPSREDIRQKCCCPTFLVATGGPWFSVLGLVLGGVFTDRFIVQPLTGMRWMALSKREEDNQVYHSARVLVALRNCLVKLQTFYRALEGPTTFIANKPHPRYFPYPTSFTAGDGTSTRFRYLTSLEEDSACVSYLAEIPNEPSTTRDSDPVKVVVKFVSRYGKEVHEFLARKGWAPTLRYCGPLPETELCSVFPGPARSAPTGLRSVLTGLAQCASPGPMHMIVMDYIDALPNTPPDVRGQIQTILALLHAEGYPNILFDAYGKVKLIDFDWCGRYDMNIHDEDLPYDVQNQIDKNKARVQVGDGPYASYPLSMSTIDGMWAPGMEPLAQIRPKHDWMMFDRLSW
ncbi:hypothetical protein EDB89DRAFT_2243611 [Lactarius sanguifluus]|nr:hypothetical protein EDB89DRAFT_2243611 [Lactarius sanguifluus]